MKIKELEAKLQKEMREFVAKGGVLVRGAWGVETHPDTDIASHVTLAEIPYSGSLRTVDTYKGVSCACALGAGIPDGYQAPHPKNPQEANEYQVRTAAGYHGLSPARVQAIVDGFDGGDLNKLWLRPYHCLGQRLEIWAHKELGYVDLIDEPRFRKEGMDEEEETDEA